MSALDEVTLASSAEPVVAVAAHTSGEHRPAGRSVAA